MGKLRVVQETTHVLADRYELGPVLGEGGMARVYRGVDRQLRRPVAVKVLAAPFDRDHSFLERFRREARAAAGLSHPNIVAVFDSGSDDGTHFIVTELVEGEALDAYQDRLQLALEASGEAWVSTTKIRGATYLRAGIVNYLSSEADIDRMLDALRRLSERAALAP